MIMMKLNALRIKHIVKPTTPGVILKDFIMPSLGFNQVQLSKEIGVVQPIISAIISEKARMTQSIADKLVILIGGSAKVWMELQENYDVWQRNNTKKKVNKKDGGGNGK